MDCSGVASTSDRSESEIGSSSGRRRSREEFEGEDLEANMQMVLADGPVPGPRSTYPKGRVLRNKFAEGWDGRTLRLAPTSHLSFRTLNGIGPGTMRTFSGYTVALRVYRKFKGELKSIIDRSALGPLVQSWDNVARNAKSRCHLVVVRAFLDRFWDTTNSFHLIPGIEAFPDVTDFSMLTGLPLGSYIIDWNRNPPNVLSDGVKALIGNGLPEPVGGEDDRYTLISSKLVSAYFDGKEVAKNSHEQNARLWLWWFLGTTYFGDKGDRLSTLLLEPLRDLDAIGSWNWVLPALGHFVRYMRAAVRPENVLSTSSPALVGPGRVMEAWILSRFTCFRNQALGVPVPTTYPAFEGWALTAQASWSYNSARVALNRMTMGSLVFRPWEGYTGVPEGVIPAARAFDGRRLFLATPFGSFWHLGERLDWQSTSVVPVVPVDPPAILFEESPDRATQEVHKEGYGESLLRRHADYSEFARSRLILDPIELGDPDLILDLPPFPETVEYVYAGGQHPLEVPTYTPVVMNSGTDDWGARLRKATGAAYLLLWSRANRWRNLASELMTRLKEKEDEVVRLQTEAVERDRVIEELRRAH